MHVVNQPTTKAKIPTTRKPKASFTEVHNAGPKSHTGKMSLQSLPKVDELAADLY